MMQKVILKRLGTTILTLLSTLLWQYITYLADFHVETHTFV